MYGMGRMVGVGESLGLLNFVSSPIRPTALARPFFLFCELAGCSFEHGGVVVNSTSR